MIRKVDLTAAAADTLESAVAWYDAERPGLGGFLLQDLLSTLDLLSTAPGIGRPAINTRGESRARVWRLRAFPYRIVYELRGERLLVVRLEHMRRRRQS